MAHNPHNLKLAILRGSVDVIYQTEASFRRSHLEPLVLENTLDGRILAIWSELGLKYNAEGSVSHDLALCVLHLFGFTSNPVLDFLSNHLCQILSNGAYCEGLLLLTSHTQALKALRASLAGHLG